MTFSPGTPTAETPDSDPDPEAAAPERPANRWFSRKPRTSRAAAAPSTPYERDADDAAFEPYDFLPADPHPAAHPIASPSTNPPNPTPKPSPTPTPEASATPWHDDVSREARWAVLKEVSDTE
ncbi:hypothetical protein B1R27_33555 [Streptomyces sp. GKU 895]|nr:hypothetical protein B1R27_33555 [Streptomyces sp. GKU 895]